MSWRLTIPIEHRIATATPLNRPTTQRPLLQRLAAMRIGAVMMRLSNLYLTPARTGLIMLTVLLLGAIVVRVITASEHSDVRTATTHESVGRATSDTGVRGLRGSLQ
jgi:hypothetical protein